MMEHVTTTRVRFNETDKQGIAHHANFILWFELGRTEYMRARGLAYSECEKRGWTLIVVETGCRYRGPVRYDEVVTIRTRVAQMMHASVRFEYALDVEGRGVAEGFTLLAAVDKTGWPTRLPKNLAEILDPGASPPVPR